MRLIARANTLQEGDLLRRPMVAGPLHVALRRPRGREQPLELKSIHNISVSAEAEFLRALRVEHLVPWSENDRAHADLFFALHLVMVDRIGLAGSNARETFRTDTALQAAFRFASGVSLTVTGLHLHECSAPPLERHLRHGRALGCGGFAARHSPPRPVALPSHDRQVRRKAGFEFLAPQETVD